MAALLSHIIVFAAASGFLTGVWVLAGGDVATLERIAADPTLSLREGFWPIWVILSWGALVVMHAGIYVSVVVFGRKHRRRRQKVAKHAMRAGLDIAREASGRRHRTRSERVADRRGPAAPAPPASPAPPGGASSVPTGPARRWVTVMFSDVSESTAHNERLGDEAWHGILARYRGIVRDALANRNGHEVGTAGDGVLARFGSPADAVLCGVDIQSSLTELRDGGDFIPEVRIGVHAGEAVEDEGDLIGRVINLASRVMEEAEPGEILVTEPVADQLVGHLQLEDKGLRPLKGLSQPRHLLAVRWTDGQT